MIRSQFTFTATVTGAEVLGEADGVTVAHGVDVTEVLGAGAVVALVAEALGAADVLGDDVPAGSLGAAVVVGLTAGSLGALVDVVADTVGKGRRRRCETAAGEAAAEVDVAGATEVLAEVLSVGVAQVVARLTALPEALKVDPECAEISIPPTTPRTATTIPIITPMWALGCSSSFRYWRATLRR
jgi:hypothetical protein